MVTMVSSSSGGAGHGPAASSSVNAKEHYHSMRRVVTPTHPAGGALRTSTRPNKHSTVVESPPMSSPSLNLLCPLLLLSRVLRHSH